MGSRDTLQPVLVEKVYQLIQSKLDSEQHSVVKQLAQHLFNNVSQDDLIDRTESDLYGAVISLWHHLNEAKVTEQSVKVFNPVVSKHGWQSTHTIIEIVVPDTPFLVDSIKMVLNRLDLACHIMLHGPAQIQRDENNKIITIGQREGELHSMFHIEVDRLTDSQK